MSVQFGTWSFEGTPLAQTDLGKIETLLAPYGPDGGRSYSGTRISMIYRAFHTTRESHLEVQPHVSRAGAVITWDGRLDNRQELLRELGDIDSTKDADVAIVGQAYDRWRTGCFRKLLGDWAVAIWDSSENTLLLAKDFLGTRHLYFVHDQNQVRWSSVLDPLILLRERPLELEEEYIAGWLGAFPAASVTPYRGVHSVPPSSYVSFRDGKRTIHEYWKFDPSDRIRYRTDRDYEEHFRTVFREAVRRRLRSDSAIMAELSGGMDSSSIVCMADRLALEGQSDAPSIETVSYFDDLEPDWNEKPFFTEIERVRGRTGTHIDLSAQPKLRFDSGRNRIAFVPSMGVPLTDNLGEFRDCLQRHHARVLLRGIGGDETLGGVPTPIPELAGLLRSVQWKKFVTQAIAFALVKREPVWGLVAESVKAFLPRGMALLENRVAVTRWLTPRFLRKYRDALRGYGSRWTVYGPPPPFQENIRVLNQLRRRFACQSFWPDPLYERRYPYLDRDLLRFLYAIPREQLVRPGQRRSLMRRALAGIVPAAVLNRERKGFVRRSSALILSEEWSKVSQIATHMTLGWMGILDPKVFAEVLETIRRQRAFPTMLVLRTLGVESWLQQLECCPFLKLMRFDRTRPASRRPEPHLRARMSLDGASDP